MSVGTGIFLSAILLSLVVLFSATKDRWNWGRVIKRGLIITTTLVTFLSAGLYMQNWWSERPTPQTEFNSIPINSTPGDVKFLKGEPTAKEGDNRWLYDTDHTQQTSTSAKYIIQFRDNQIHFILYYSGESANHHPYLLGLSNGSSYQDIKNKLGKPSITHESNDQLNRIICYEKLKAFFILREGQSYAYGIYEPKLGPLKFTSKFKSNEN